MKFSFYENFSGANSDAANSDAANNTAANNTATNNTTSNNTAADNTVATEENSTSNSSVSNQYVYDPDNLYYDQSYVNNKINQALNNKLKQTASYSPNETHSDFYMQLKKVYNNYVASLPYDIPKQFSVGVFLMIVVAFLVPTIVLTVFGSKSIHGCNQKHVSLSIFIALFLVFTWLGNIVPYYGQLASVISMMITTILIIVANASCSN